MLAKSFVCLSFGPINRNQTHRYCLLLSFHHRLYNYYVLKQLPSVDDHVVKTIKKTTKLKLNLNWRNLIAGRKIEIKMLTIVKVMAIKWWGNPNSKSSNLGSFNFLARSSRCFKFADIQTLKIRCFKIL